MQARFAATLICLCGQALSAPGGAGDAPQGTRAPAPTVTQVSVARETPGPPVTPGQDPEASREGTRRAPAASPATAEPAQRERGLLLAGIALMIGIALRRLGAGAP
ncbi:MAG: hypothetical protein RI884_2050 [Pseudomonadota bacterium]|jgi:hypothetical protein